MSPYTIALGAAYFLDLREYRDTFKGLVEDGLLFVCHNNVGHLSQIQISDYSR